MFVKNDLFRVGIVSVLLFLLTGCGLIGGNNGLVSQGVAFPQPGDAPPTSEGTLPQPAAAAASPTKSNMKTTESTPFPTAQATETAVPQPTRPLPTDIPPQITSFTADVMDNNQGKRITFAWESNGAASARIYNWANGSERFPAFWDVAPSGSLTVDLSGTRRSDPHFELFIYTAGDDNPAGSRSLQVPWDCSIDYFFEPGSDICPWSEAINTTAATQPFEGGIMVWLEALDWIYVLYNEVYPDGQQGGDLQWQRYDDNWTEEDADSQRTLQPPSGFFAPVGGFSLIWQENPEVRERLGWATAPEAVFEGAWQLQPSDTDYQGDSAIFIQLENNEVVRLSGFDIWGWMWAVVGTVN